MKKLLSALAFISSAFLMPAHAQLPTQLETCVELSDYAGLFYEAKQQGADATGLITNIALGVDDEKLQEIMYSLVLYVFFTPEGDKPREEFLKTFFFNCMAIGEDI